jgi:menaquinone-dependent protoporphyrinogen oxidase
MKVLIAYAGKTGTTAKASAMLAKYFGKAEIADLSKSSPDPGCYDVVIIGSAIRFGMVMKPVRKWLVGNWDVLKDKKKALFICNAFLGQAPSILKDNYSLALRNSSITVDSFGGEMDMKNLHGFDRFFVKMVMNRMRAGKAGKEFVPVILTDRIRVFADTVKEAMAEPAE